MFQLKKNFRFDASHELKKSEGKNKRRHEHAWVGYIIVEGEERSTLEEKRNMLLDYAVLGEWTTTIESKLNGKDLNEVVEKEMPTSELVAKYAFDVLSPRFKTSLKLVAVGFRETCTVECEYRPTIKNDLPLSA